MTRKFLTQIVLPSDPSTAMEAATKQYVDANSGGGGFIPAGVIWDYVGMVAPSTWAILDGSTLEDCDTEHPDLWAVAPTAWRSGSDLILPDTRGRTSVGYDATNSLFNAIGKISGTPDTVVVTHTHTIDHNHGAVTSGNNSVGHTHTIDHNHGAVTSGNNSVAHNHGVGTLVTAGAGSHNHNIGGGALLYYVLGGQSEGTPGPGSAGRSGAYAAAGNHTHTISGNTGSNSANHTHSVDLPNFTGTSGAASANHTHSVDLPNFTGTSGAASDGVTGANQNYQPSIALVKIIKL